MKKKILVLILIFAMVLTACSNKENNNDDKLNIVTSFFPPYDLVTKIGGEKVNVKNITATGDAHSFEPSIKDMEDIINSDLLVINGAGFESWIEQVKQSQGDLKILSLSDNLELIQVKDNNGNMINDPHTWLSVENPLIMLKTIYEKLIEIDPTNKDYYTQNYEKYSAEFNNLKEEYDDKLSKYSGKSFVAPHAAFNYLVQKYNLDQVGIEGINSVGEPNAARMKEVVEEMKLNDIKTVFYEYGQSDRIAKSIANEIGGDVKPISTLEVITQEDIDNGDDYISLLRMNLDNLVYSFENK